MVGRILIIEDEFDLAEPVQEALRDEGHEVQIAVTGAEARRQLEHHWDLVLLDLMLPDLPGEAVLNYLKQQPVYPPVLILTAKSRLEDKLAMFRQGCDDYLTKPFSLDELLERVHALLRRAPRPVSENCMYEDLALDPVSHRLSVGGESVVLTPKESAICRLLMSQPGRIVSRKELLQGIWGSTEDPAMTSNPLGVHVFNLRKKLTQLGRGEWFQTLRSSGFVICKPEAGAHGS